MFFYFFVVCCCYIWLLNFILIIDYFAISPHIHLQDGSHPVAFQWIASNLTGDNWLPYDLYVRFVNKLRKRNLHCQWTTMSKWNHTVNKLVKSIFEEKKQNLSKMNSKKKLKLSKDPKKTHNFLFFQSNIWSKNAKPHL